MSLKQKLITSMKNSICVKVSVYYFVLQYGCLFRDFLIDYFEVKYDENNKLDEPSEKNLGVFLKNFENYVNFMNEGIIKLIFIFLNNNEWANRIYNFVLFYPDFFIYLKYLPLDCNPFSSVKTENLFEDIIYCICLKFGPSKATQYFENIKNHFKNHPLDCNFPFNIPIQIITTIENFIKKIEDLKLKPEDVNIEILDKFNFKKRIHDSSLFLLKFKYSETINQFPIKNPEFKKGLEKMFGKQTNERYKQIFDVYCDKKVFIMFVYQISKHF